MSNLGIGWLNQLIIIFVTRANLGIRAAIGTRAFALLCPPFDIVNNPLVFYYVFRGVVPFSAEKGCVIRRIAINLILPEKVQDLHRFLVIFEMKKAVNISAEFIIGCVKQLLKLLLLLIVKLMIGDINTKVLLLVLIINLNTFFQYLLYFHFDHLPLYFLPFFGMHFIFNILFNMLNMGLYFRGHFLFFHCV